MILGVNKSIDRKAIRWIENMPAWVTAMVNNIPITTRLVIPITYQLMHLEKTHALTMKSITSLILSTLVVICTLLLQTNQVYGQVFSDVSLSIFERLSAKNATATPASYTPNVVISKKKGSDKLFTLTYIDERSHLKVVITDYIFLRSTSISLHDVNYDGKPDVLLRGMDSNGYLVSKSYQNDGITNWVEFLPPLDNLPPDDPKWRSFNQDTVVISKNIPAAQFTTLHERNP